METQILLLSCFVIIIIIIGHDKENMKEQKPCVTWDIRCFHYERRRLLCMLLLVDLWTFLYNLVTKRNVQEGEGEKESLQLGPSIFTKKVVSHQTSQYYKFNR